MSYREYVGARYVPLFADPLEWDSTKTYEPLTVVYYQGNSYTSRQAVPAGIELSNTTYWAMTGNYNAQVEQYRTEVQAFDRRITANADEIEDLHDDITQVVTDTDAKIDEVKDSVTAVNNRISARHMVIIGDSWVNPQTHGYYLKPYIKDSMNLTDSQIHMYGRSGTGFLRVYDVNFTTQLDNAIADTSFDNEDVAYVMVLGGTNDYDAGYTNAGDYTDVLSSICQTIIENFPNADYRIFFMQGKVGRTYPYHMIKQVKANCNGNIVNTAWPISFQLFDDALHVTNTAGNRELARFIASEFLGFEYRPYTDGVKYYTSNFNSAFGSGRLGNGHLQYTWTEDTISIMNIMMLSQNIMSDNPLFGFCDLDGNESLNIPTWPGIRLVGSQMSALQNDNVFQWTIDNNKTLGFNTRTRRIDAFQYHGYVNYVWY